MILSYEKTHDVLYVTFKRAKMATSLGGAKDVLLRVDPESHEVVGVTIIGLREVLDSSESIPVPYCEDRAEKTRLRAIIDRSLPALRRTGRRAYRFNLHFEFTPKMARALEP